MAITKRITVPVSHAAFNLIAVSKIPIQAGTQAWVSGTPAVATVVENGTDETKALVTPLTVGTTLITVSADIDLTGATKTRSQIIILDVVNDAEADFAVSTDASDVQVTLDAGNPRA